ncbi:cytochrome c oxidase subunit II [Calidithermus roseus]|uniref:cytochrome-c oxidase n=1 Tax=Calidithermus roseus TaxID=1644118 RepID=A0A399EL21_9DEIN|nr:cytochrome-c oxidase [Calidithermus roseus]RIH82871.1 Alternative cytochrome c oxidase subunit 2 [Calidithermus roseus]
MQALALAITLVGMVLGAFLLTALRVWWFAPLASNWGNLDKLIIISLVLCGGAFIAINLFVAYTIYAHNSHRGRKAFFFVDNPRLEWRLIWLTAIGIVLLLAPGLYFYAQVITPPQKPYVIEVLTQQWLWSYRYPGKDGVLGPADIKNYSPANPFGVNTEAQTSQDDVPALGGPLYLPLGQPVLLRMRSNDVLHSFFVPEFRMKMDVVPGMVTQMWFTPTRTGEFQVICAELCGVGHSTMIGKVVVVEPKEFERWLEERPTIAQTLQSTGNAQR